jgi:hypothetical protein
VMRTWPPGLQIRMAALNINYELMKIKN